MSITIHRLLYLVFFINIIIYSILYSKYGKNIVSTNLGTVKKRSPYPEFVLTNFICIEKALKGTEVVLIININRNFVLTK